MIRAYAYTTHTQGLERERKREGERERERERERQAERGRERGRERKRKRGLEGCGEAETLRHCWWDWYIRHSGKQSGSFSKVKH
jgi:hypothetical protein